MDRTGTFDDQAGGNGFGVLSVVFVADGEAGGGGIARSDYERLRRGEGPRVGDPVGGGGVVADVKESTFTVQFPGGAPKGPIDVPWTCTILVAEPAPKAGSGQGGRDAAGPAVGDAVGGDGVVVHVSDSTITVEFPHGAPQGPINLPLIDEAVVIEGADRTGGDDWSSEEVGDAGEPEGYLYSDFRSANMTAATAAATAVDNAIVQRYIDEALRLEGGKPWEAWLRLTSMREQNCRDQSLAVAEHYMFARGAVAQRGIPVAAMVAWVLGYAYAKFVGPGLLLRTGSCEVTPASAAQVMWGLRGAADGEAQLLPSL
jgi:hypothetical protein